MSIEGKDLKFPAYVWEAEWVSVPAPSFVTPAAPEIPLETVVFPAPPIVSKPPALIVPVCTVNV